MTDFMSIEQATEQLNTAAPINTKEEKTGAADAAADDLPQDLEADPDELLTDDEDAAEEPSGDDDGDEGDEEADESSPIQAPEFWDAASKAKFAKLDPEAQQLILDQAKPASAAVSKALNEAALVKKAAESEVQKFTQNRAALEQYLAQAVPDHSKKWDNIDWATWLATDFQAATVAKASMEREIAHLQQLKAVKEQTDQIAHNNFISAEVETLKALGQSDPATKRLIDPEKGAEARNATQQYLLKAGVRQEQLMWISAQEMSIAHKAMLYDNLQAKQASKGASVPQKATTQTSGQKVRVSTTPSTPASVTSVTSAKQRLAKTGSVDDAVALMMAQSNRNRR